MKTLAFSVALAIMVVGASGIVAPSGLVWVAQRSAISSVFYVIATVRIAFGAVLIAAAPVSRAPRALRVLGALIVIAGVATALTGLLAIERADAAIEWWLRQGSGVVRLTAMLIVVLGGFVAYACVPRSAERR